MSRVAIIVGAGTIGGAIAAHLAGRFDVHVASHAVLELTSAESVRRYFERFGRIDVLINAAGSYGEIGRVRDVSPSAWCQALDVNLFGVYASCHHALHRMPAGSHIINLAGGGQGPMEMRSGYASAKSALWRLTETLAAEEPTLHVNAIAPGPMDSRMQDVVASRAEPWAEFARQLRCNGRGAVPIERTLRVVDHILDVGPTGSLFFARTFSPAPEEAHA